jgi:hypothetical protein
MECNHGDGGTMGLTQKIEAAAAIGLGGLALVAVGVTIGSYTHKNAVHVVGASTGRSAEFDVPAWDYPASSKAAAFSAHPREIPVLAYHQLDNGCTARALMCGRTGAGAEILSERQFYDQMSYLHSQGYSTITDAQYVLWAMHKAVALPAKPILLTVDDGIDNFYAPATAVLRHFGYNMVSMVVSGFASGAQDGVRPYAGWDASWTQLRALNPAIWGIAFHAGAQGHLLFTGACQYFYPCQRAGESDAAYQARVSADVLSGKTLLKREIPSADTQIWTVPWNDLAQTPNQPQSGDEPKVWLQGFAQGHFPVIFVDAFVSNAQGEHYRFEVHGTESMAYFIHELTVNTHGGAFNG